MSVADDFPIKEVIPHSHEMILIDEVIDHGAEFLTARVRIKPSSLFAEAEGVPAWVGVDYMAQTIAAWSGVNAKLEGRDVKVGYLVATRKYTAHQMHFAVGELLTIHVQQEYFLDEMGIFQCSITSDKLVAEAALNVYQPD